MRTSVEIASDVIAGGTALAGLILVHIDGVAARYANFRTEDQPAVRCNYVLKAWFGFLGTIFSIAGATVAPVAKWWGSAQDFPHLLDWPEHVRDERLVLQHFERSAASAGATWFPASSGSDRKTCSADGTTSGHAASRCWS